MCTTYNALGVKLTGTLQVYDGCARYKAKYCTVRKKTYTRVSQPVERIFVDTTGPFSEIFIWNRYWIGILDNYSHYSWSFSTKTKLQLPKKMEEFLENMTSQVTTDKYPSCDNAGEHKSILQQACKK